MVTRTWRSSVRITQIQGTEVSIITILGNIIRNEHTRVFRSCIGSRGITVCNFTTVCADTSGIVIVGTVRNDLIVAPVSVSSTSSIETTIRRASGKSSDALRSSRIQGVAKVL
jgi:hypothetical protein